MVTIITSTTSNKKPYGFWHFVGDVLLGIITGGIWWLFLLFRALKKG